ncbi:p21-activated protein kinase-interacting protein 1-like protein [Stygiomarasmius scandens]|uniref:P21-activated protein kinase-interacting protein 1-like protein n=1 Tax=Marasmiellus scandens TaxID=2682957 RepID=A0ABR1INX7_9AGAR
MDNFLPWMSPRTIPVSLEANTVICISFSTNGKFLAVASGKTIDVWNIARDPPQIVTSDSSSDSRCVCLTWLVNQPTLITGHENGDLSLIILREEGNSCTRNEFCYDSQKIYSISVLEDRLLAVAVGANVRLWEIIYGQPRYLGQLPPAVFPDGSLMVQDLTPQRVLWGSGREIVVCYSDSIVRWSVKEIRPLIAKLAGHRELSGALIDVFAKEVGLVARPSDNEYTLISLKSSHLAASIPRAYGLPRIGSTSQAIFVNGTVVEGGISCLYLWDFTGQRVQILDCPKTVISTLFA